VSEHHAEQLVAAVLSLADAALQGRKQARDPLLDSVLESVREIVSELLSTTTTTRTVDRYADVPSGFVGLATRIEGRGAETRHVVVEPARIALVRVVVGVAQTQHRVFSALFSRVIHPSVMIHRFTTHQERAVRSYRERGLGVAQPAHERERVLGRLPLARARHHKHQHLAMQSRKLFE